LPETLTQAQRERKKQLLDLGLSDYYVSLCFDAHSQGVISAGRLAEALLATETEMAQIAELYGRTIHGD
jgi:hypothetical protein